MNLRRARLMSLLVALRRNFHDKRHSQPAREHDCRTTDKMSELHWYSGNVHHLRRRVLLLNDPKSNPKERLMQRAEKLVVAAGGHG
jgi:hypothetical protein